MIFGFLALALFATGAPTWEEASNATYRGVQIATRNPVTLVNGAWEAPRTGTAPGGFVKLAPGVYATGDLNGDGNPEAVVLVIESGGGTGVFSSVAVLEKKGNQITNIAMSGIGDRVQIRGLRIENGKILLDVVQGSATDPACCPGDLASRSWTMTANRLTEGPMKVTGRLGVAAMEGPEWKLTGWDIQEPAEDQPAITLKVEGSRIGGRSACNRYMGAVQAGQGPGDISIKPAGATLMACPQPAMTLERRFTEALSGVHRLSFFNGQLALTYRTGDKFGTLLFQRVEKAP